MVEFDYNGLLLAEFQGKLFERSSELNCSTEVFMRRFLYSNLLKKLDSNRSELLALDVDEGIADIIEQFGDTDYGKEKYAASALFWIGYMYRYISYTRQQSTKFVTSTFPCKLMNDVYVVYHTQDPEWCIQNLLSLSHLTEDYFDNNFRLKQIMRHYYKKI